MSGPDLVANVLDLVLVAAGLLALLRGWRQGAIVRVFALGGLVAGLLSGACVALRVATSLGSAGGPGTGGALLTPGILVVAMLAGRGIGSRVGLALRLALVPGPVPDPRRVGASVPLGAGGHTTGRPDVEGPREGESRRPAGSPAAAARAVDRGLGPVVGVVGVAVVVWLLAGVVGQGPVPSLARQVQGSAIVGALDRALPARPGVVEAVGNDLGRQTLSLVFPRFGDGITAPPVPDTADPAVRAAAGAGRPSTVRVRAAGCGMTLGSGSGFVVAPGFVVTNAHVVEGFGRLSVQDTEGSYSAEPVLFDREIDIAVLAVPDLEAPALAWRDGAAERGDDGATLGFPGGRTDLVVEPATVRSRIDVRGGDAGTGGRREVLVLAAAVEQGDSGGPFVTADGRVAGVVFAGAPDGSPTGYALTAEQVRPEVTDAVARAAPVDTGICGS